MKKMFVFLFPAENYTMIQEQFLKDEFNENFVISDIFDTLIEKKYIDKGYEFVIATYANHPISGITVNPNRIVNSNVEQESFYLENDSMLKNYDDMALSLNPQEYSEIVVGGYHLGINQEDGCVNHFANSINKISNNAIIDRELTNEFINYVFKTNANYNICLNEQNKYYELLKEKIENKKSERKL